MPRSVALTGLVVMMSLAMVGFAAFSPDQTVPQAGIDVPGVDATAAAAVFAAPLVPLLEATPPTTTTAAPAPLERFQAPEVASTEPSTTTTTAPPPTTSPPPTTAAPTTTAPPATTPPTTSPPTTTPPTTTPPTTAAPPDTAPPTTAAPSPSSWPPAVEQWRGLVSGSFSGARIEEALAIISCESNGDPNITNPVSGAAGLFQFLRATWDWVAGEAGLGSYDSGAPYDPVANIAAASWLVQRSIDTDYSRGPWGHWSCRWVLG